MVEEECHPLGGDICGRGWANCKQRLDIKVKNYLDSKTYYGALDCQSGQMFLQSYSIGLVPEASKVAAISR